MTAHVDYYFSLTSPWSYLGHDRLMEIVGKHNATVAPYEVSFRSTIFGKTGGLPVHKRAPQRQSYRLQELVRWSDYLGIKLNVHPKHWPNDETQAANSLVFVREAISSAAALKFAGLVMRAVWAENRDISDPGTVQEIADTANLDGALVVAESNNPDWAALRNTQTENAINSGVFGAPSYCVGQQVYWGQDRLDFVDRQLQSLVS